MVFVSLTSIAYDYPNVGERKQELVKGIIGYIGDYARYTHMAARKKSWAFNEALEMRKRVSGEMGTILGQIFSYASEKQYDPDSATILWNAGMIGQFQDELWDINEETGIKTYILGGSAAAVQVKLNHPEGGIVTLAGLLSLP